MWKLYTSIRGATPFKFGLIEVYKLRRLNSFWEKFLGHLPELWTLFPLAMMDNADVVFVADHSKNTTLKVYVIVEDIATIGRFHLMLQRLGQGASDRIAFLHLSIDAYSWPSIQPSMTQLSFSRLTHLFLNTSSPPPVTLADIIARSREVLSADGQYTLSAESVALATWEAGQPSPWPNVEGILPTPYHDSGLPIVWDNVASSSYVPWDRPDDIESQQATMVDFSRFLALQVLCLHGVDIISPRFQLPPNLTTLHIGHAYGDGKFFRMHFSTFCRFFESVPSLVQLELWRVGFGFDDAEPCTPIIHHNIRHFAICCSSTSLRPIFAYLRHCALDNLVLRVETEADALAQSLDGPDSIDDVLGFITSVFTMHHIITGVGMVHCQRDDMLWVHTVELFFTTQSGGNMTLHVHQGMADRITKLLSSNIPSSIPFALQLSGPRGPTEEIARILFRLIPWSRFSAIHIQANPAASTMIDAMKDSFGTRQLSPIMLHCEHRALGYQTLGRIWNTPGLSRIDIGDTDGGCCAVKFGTREPWTTPDGEELFSPFVLRRPTHLSQMLKLTFWYVSCSNISSL